MAKGISTTRLTIPVHPERADMGRQEGKIAIREMMGNLGKLGSELGGDLVAIWNFALGHVLDAQKSDKGHSAGPSHVERVEENISWLIPDELKGKKVNATELFLLSAAACLHDNGRIDPATTDHGVTGAEEIRRNWVNYKLDEMKAGMVADIIWVHTDKNRLYEIETTRHLGTEEIRLRDIAALFSLADALDCDHRRILMGAKEDHPVTRFRRLVSGKGFDPIDESCIFIEFVPKNPVDEEDFWRGLEHLIGEEIRPIALQLDQAGYPSKLRGKPVYAHFRGKINQVELRSLPGLDFYTEFDESIFRGRREETNLLWRCVLSEIPVSLLCGRSGVGKTSLIRAGLFPRLKRAGWHLVHCRLPFDDPTRQIIKDVWRELLEGEPLPRSIVEALEQNDIRNRDIRTLIVLDQFENLMRATPERLDDLSSAIRQILNRRLPNLRLLISYQAEAHAEIMDFLQTIPPYTGHLPNCPLRLLSQEGAKEALEALFRSARIEVETTSGQGATGSFMETVLNDIQTQAQGFYPPYLQMVAATIIDKAKEGKNTADLELYQALGGASVIIGRFLLDRLRELGELREIAESVLKALVGSGGFVRQRSFEDIQSEVGPEITNLRNVLRAMEMKRLIRPLESDRYEVIHPCLARLVDQELGEEEREIKRLRERLFSKSREYSSTRDLLSMTDLARLYLIREVIVLDNIAAKLLMHCCLAGVGPAWYWFKDWTTDKCLPIIAEGLSHPSEVLSANAARLLVQTKESDSLDWFRKVCESANQDLHPKVREFAAKTMAKYGTDRDIPYLRKLLKDTDWDVKTAAIEALVSHRIIEALPEIRSDIDSHRWSVRRAVVKAIAGLGGESEQQEILELLNHKDPYRRAAALEALVRAKPNEAATKIDQMLDDPDWHVRTEGIKLLIEFRRGEASRKLGELFAKEDNSGVKEFILQRMGDIGSKEALPCLLRGLKDNHYRVKIAAVQTIGRLGLVEALTELDQSQYDRDWLVRREAVKTLAVMEGVGSAERLQKFLFSSDVNKQIGALEAIAELRLTALLPLLKDLLRSNPNRIVKNTIAKTILALDGENSLPFFRNLIEKGKLAVKISVCNALLSTAVGKEQDMELLAKLIVSSPMGYLSGAANNALVELDRTLHSPFTKLGYE